MDLNNLSIRKATTHQEFLDVQNLHKTIWGLEDIDVHPIHMLIGIQKSNGLVLCGYYDNQPIGFLFGYCGITEDQELYLHCHNVAVLKEYRNCGIGYQLLMATKEYMLTHKIQLARATFDPLESGNANLYIKKAGCICNKYIRDYYGPMSDQLNINVPSDRLVIEYFLNTNCFEQLSDETQSKIKLKTLKIPSEHILNKTKIDHTGFLIPEKTNFNLDYFIQKKVKRVYIEIPPDYQQMRQKNMDLVLKWRFLLRDILEQCFVAGMFIRDFIVLEDHYYYALGSCYKS